MLQAEAIARLRTGVDDSGLFVTSFGLGTVAAGSPTIPIDDPDKLMPGLFITIGSPAAVEGYLVVAVDVANKMATITPAMVSDHGRYTPVSVPAYHDDVYTTALAAALRKYSSYRPLQKRYSLALVAGTDTYTLPADFIEPDQDSFDKAIGLTSESSIAGSFYSLIYDLTNRFTTVSYGQSSGFAQGIGYGLVPFGTTPAENLNVTGNPGRIVYRFLRSSPAKLIIDPAPTVARTLDFYYNAVHTIPVAADMAGNESTLGVDDTDLPLLYARFLLCQAFATNKAAINRYELNGEKIDQTKGPDAYQAIGSTALAEFEKEVRFVPFGIRG